MRRSGGHTLAELLVVLALAAALLAAGAPGMADLLARLRLRGAANELFAAITLARAQALARGTRVVMTPLEPSGADWSGGWRVFVDANGNLRLDPGEELLAERGPPGGGIAIRAAFSSAHAPAYLAYNSAGRGCGADNSMAARWGTLSLQSGRHARHIKINMLGRVRVCDPAAEPATCTGLAGE
ncbi:GspH/FimT family protein [Janthinobacterium sp.]|uniref:GspH/FimT family pseudopilin n=1 Tax=Janthinobacterium sp. TaxID=1871054 RepID=UPI00293D7A92|nr:GspH/FimT family protein [Janthinobacterium sp.]